MAAVTETVTVASAGSVRRRLLHQPVALKSRLPVETGATGRQKPKSSVRLDPVMILEPARKKLSSLEAQRVVGALRDAIRRAEVVVSLPVVLRNLEERRGLFEEETVLALEEHRALLTGIRAEALEEMIWTPEKRRPESCDGDERMEEVEDIEAAEEREELDGEGVRPEKKYLEEAQMKESLVEVDEEKDEEEEECKIDKHSEMGRETMTMDRSGVSDINGEEEEEEEEEEEKDAEEDQDEAGHEEENFETSETLGGTTEDSEPQETRSRVRMEIPQHSLMVVAESCRNILRSFPTNQKPVFELLDECRSGWKESSADVIRCLKDLSGILTTMLLMSPAEELERARCLRELLERERCNSEIIVRLSAELSAAEDEKNEAILRQNDVIRKLQSTLHSIEKTSEENICRMKLEAEKQMAADKKTLEGQLTKLQQYLTHVQAKYNNLKEEHKEKELALRRRKYQVETEVENWIQKFDMDMGERQDEYERNDLVYTEEKRQLNELEEKFRRLEAEYLQIQEERRIAREKRDLAERELQACVRAAITIQAFWRSFKVRKAIRAKKKKGVTKGKK